MINANCLFVSLTVYVSTSLAYVPSWDSLDSRPIPPWYDQARIGILIQWGVFSVPSHSPEAFWWGWQGNGLPATLAALDYVKRNHRAYWTYANFAPDLTADLFHADTWAELFNASGAKYVVLTAKSNDGFCLWPSRHSFNWNSMDVGPKRDLVGELAEAVRGAGLRFGVHYSFDEYYNEMLRHDKASSFTKNLFSRSKVQPELRELVFRYKPAIIKVDGDTAPDTYWNSTGFLAWLYNDSPVAEDVVVNDGWGAGITCKHGDYFNCGTKFNPGAVHPHKFENVFSLDKISWGYRRTMNLASVMSMEELLTQIVSTVACHGNVLVSVGARMDGTFPTIFEERLRQMGRWIAVNQEAIFGTEPWLSPRDIKNPDIWYVKKENLIFVFVTKWPGKILELASISTKVVRSVSKVELLGAEPSPQRFVLFEKGLTVEFPCASCAQPLKWVWVLKVVC